MDRGTGQPVCPGGRRRDHRAGRPSEKLMQTGAVCKQSANVGGSARRPSVRLSFWRRFFTRMPPPLPTHRRNGQIEMTTMHGSRLTNHPRPVA